MELRQINIMVPKVTWDAVGKLADDRRRNSEPVDTRRAILAVALEEYLKSNGVKK